MPTKKSAQFSIDMLSAKVLLEGVGQQLSTKPWFKDWRISVHYFPPAPAAPESVTMHVFKPGWFNEDAQGIHFEAHFGPKQWNKLELPVMLHLFHSATIPGTAIKRLKVSQPFVDKVYKKVSQWPGYSFRAGKYGTQPFSCTLSFSNYSDTDFEIFSAAFQKRVAEEFTRLCNELGPEVDRALQQALDS